MYTAVWSLVNMSLPGSWAEQWQPPAARFPGGRLLDQPRFSKGGVRRNACARRPADSRTGVPWFCFFREASPGRGVRVRHRRWRGRWTARTERPRLPGRPARQAASFQTARTLTHAPGPLFSRLIGPLHAPEPVPRPCLRAGTSMEPVLACCAARLETGISRG